MSRLEKKGYIQSAFGEATPVRGGRRKKYYQLTQEGKTVLEAVRTTRNDLWKAVPNYKLGLP